MEAMTWKRLSEGSRAGLPGPRRRDCSSETLRRWGARAGGRGQTVTVTGANVQASGVTVV